MKEKILTNVRIIDPSQQMDEDGNIIIDKNGKIKKNKGNILVITHGSFIDHLVSKLTNSLPKDNIKGTPTNCSLTIINVIDNKYKIITVKHQNTFNNVIRKNICFFFN